MRLLYIPFFCTLLFLCSCDCHEIVTCTQPYNHLYIVGYTASEVDTAIVKRYKPDNSFSSIVDSMSYPLPQVSTDTFSAGISVEDKYNYDIELKKPGRHYRISNIVTEGNTVKNMSTSCFYKKMPACFNHITSLKVDEATIQFADEGPEYSPVYLVK